MNRVLLVCALIFGMVGGFGLRSGLSGARAAKPAFHTHRCLGTASGAMITEIHNLQSTTATVFVSDYDGGGNKSGPDKYTPRATIGVVANRIVSEVRTRANVLLNAVESSADPNARPARCT
jgi:hypothetical protein